MVTWSKYSLRTILPSGLFPLQLRQLAVTCSSNWLSCNETGSKLWQLQISHTLQTKRKRSAAFGSADNTGTIAAAKRRSGMKRGKFALLIVVCSSHSSNRKLTDKRAAPPLALQHAETMHHHLLWSATTFKNIHWAMFCKPKGRKSLAGPPWNF